MAIAFRAVGTAANAASGNVVPALPTGHVANDILILLVASSDAITHTVTGYTQIDLHSASTLTTSVWWKRDNGAESAPTVTHTAGSGIVAVIACWSGVSTAASPAPIDASSLWKVNAPATTSTTNILTTASVSTVLIECFCTNSASETYSAYSGSPTPTQRFTGPAVASRPSITIADSTIAAAGTAVGSRTVTQSVSANSYGIQFTLALQGTGVWTSTSLGDGTATTSLKGAALAIGVESATGLASTSLVGASLDIGVMSGTGSASMSLVGATLDIGVMSGTGAASTSLVGATLAIGVASGTGVASTSLVGAKLMIGVMSGLGAASTSLVGASLVASPMSGAGAASTSLVGAALAIGVESGTGVASTSIAGAALAIGVESGTGVASTSLIGAALDIAVMSGTGSASSALVGAALDLGVENGVGIASTSLVGAALALGVMSGAGVASTSFDGSTGGTFAIGEMNGLGVASAALVGATAGHQKTLAQLLAGNPTEAELNALIKAGYGGTTRKTYSPTGYPERPEPQEEQPKPPEPTIKPPRARQSRGKAVAAGESIGAFGGNARARARADASPSAGSFGHLNARVRVTAAMRGGSESATRFDSAVMFDHTYLERASAIAVEAAKQAARADAEVLAREHAAQLEDIKQRADAFNARATNTARHVHVLHSVGLATRRYRMPRQIWPKSIEMEYGKAMIGLLERARPAFAPLLHDLPGMLDRAAADRRGDRADAGEPERARKLIETVRARLAQAMQPNDVESLARLFGKRTQTYQRVQLGRQVRAALGVDVLASDGGRLTTLLDHFVHENAVLIKTIPADCISEIEKRVTRAFTDATPSGGLADEIEERFDISERHARLIARDQIGKLYGQTNAARQQDIGIEAFIWRTAGDERVRDEHQALDGQQFDYSDPPSEGLPGEPIQCRCYAEPVISAIRNASEGASEET